MTPLTVMQVLPALEGGGVERGTVETAAALIAAGHRAVVVSSGGRLETRLKDLGAECVRLPVGRKSPQVLLETGRLRAVIRETGAEVVHARSRLPAWIAWFALRRLNPRPVFITTLHGLNSVSRYSAIMTRGDRVIAVSETARDYWLTHYPQLEPERVVLIHRGIDPTEFPYGHRPSPQWLSDLRRNFDIPEQRRLLCLPGRVRRLKGHPDLLTLVAELAADGLDVHALVPGGGARGGYRREMDRQAAKLGVLDRISWLGPRDDIRDVLAASDVVLSLSQRPESFGRTVAEALALGRPTAGWDHGGVGEVLARVYPAGRVPAFQLPDLARTVASLLEAPPPVPDRQPFLLADCTEQTLALYQSLVR